LILPNLPEMKQLHDEFLQGLTDQLKQGVPLHDNLLGNFLKEFCPKFAESHVIYASRFSSGSTVLAELYDNNEGFATLVDRCGIGKSMSGVIGLSSLRHAPIQRIPRYVLLLKDLSRHTPETHPDHNPISEAVQAFQELTLQINAQANKFDNQMKLENLDRRLQGNRSSLTQSTLLSESAHRWRKRTSNIPTVCNVCGALIRSGKVHSHCSRCGTSVHRKHCQALSEICSSKTTLIENGREYIGEFSFRHSSLVLNAGKKTDKQIKERQVNVVVFSDSIMIYHGRDPPILIKLIRWKSFTTGRVIGISESSDVNKVTITAPRDGELHFLFADDPAQKVEFLNMTRGAFQKWLDTNNSELTQSKSQPINEKNLFRADSGASIDSRIRFTISSTVPVQSGNKIFTAYVIDITDSHGERSLVKRYSEFVTLHCELRETYDKTQLSKLPSKRVLRNNTDKMFIQRRCRGLEQYLNDAVQLPGMLKNKSFLKWMNTTVDAPPRSLKDSMDCSNWIEDEGSDDDEGEDEPTLQTDSSLLAVISLGEVLYNFTGDTLMDTERSRALPVQRGDVLTILSQENSDWWFCRARNQAEGYVPASYISVYKS